MILCQPYVVTKTPNQPKPAKTTQNQQKTSQNQPKTSYKTNKNDPKPATIYPNTTGLRVRRWPSVMLRDYHVDNQEVKFSDHVYYRWPRSIYRPLCRPLYRSTLDRLSGTSRSTVGRQSTDCRPMVGRLATDIAPDSRPIVVSTDTVFDRRYSTDT